MLPESSTVAPGSNNCRFPVFVRWNAVFSCAAADESPVLPGNTSRVLQLI